MSHFIKSTRGSAKLVDEMGHIYFSDKKTPGKWYWICEVKGCRGKVHTRPQSDHIIHTPMGHTHAPRPGRAEALQITASIKEKSVQAPMEMPRNVIADTMGEVPELVSVLVPSGGRRYEENARGSLYGICSLWKNRHYIES